MKKIKSIKRSLGLVLFLLLSFALKAQQSNILSNNIPQNITGTINPVAAYPGISDLPALSLHNYIRTKIPDVPSTVVPTSVSPAVIYQQDFNTGPYTPVYTNPPVVLNPFLLHNSTWMNTQSSWTSYNGIEGRAIAVSDARNNSTVLELNIPVTSGYSATINSFSFYNRSSSTGYNSWRMFINNQEVASGNIFVDALNGAAPLQSTGLITLTSPVMISSGTVNIQLQLSGGQHGRTATFRLDQFILNGSVLPESYVRTVTDFYDGLGRPLQSVAKNAMADRSDVIKHHVYDNSGRAAYSYLPLKKTTAASYGKFEPGIASKLHQQYDQLHLGEHPYAKTEYDNSPLNRVTKQLAPGSSWVGNNRGTKQIYTTNAGWIRSTLNSPNPISQLIKGPFPVWRIEEGMGAIPVSASFYNDHELSGIKIIDEDGKINEEFKDKSGKLILKRSLLQASDNATEPELNRVVDDYIYTHYVYDDLGRLRVVIPPGVRPQEPVIVNNMHVSYWTVTAQQMEELCYQYVYDERGRMIEKKVPGKAVEYLVYDKRDRLVAYQDAHLRAQNKWKFTLYDALDRQIVDGLVTASLSRAQLQEDYINTNTTYPNTHWLYYVKNYNLWQDHATTLEANNQYTILSRIYYDDYDNIPATGYGYSNQMPPVNQPYLVQPVINWANKGLVTQVQHRVLEAPAATWMTTVNYYDDNNRLIQSICNNIGGGMDTVSNAYYFQGMVWKTINKHANPNAQALPGSSAIVSNMVLEDAYYRNIIPGGGNELVGRHMQKINNGTDFELAKFDYDYNNQISTTQFSFGNISQKYNIRGWLTSIDAYPYFKEDLFYDKGFASQLYNGNISGITWSGYYEPGGPVAGSMQQNAYGYTYDRLNRLNHAEYRTRSNPQGVWHKDHKDYSVSNLNYDANGNILSMDQRNPGVGSAPIDMDRLSYTYAANSNKLIKVKDDVTAATTYTLPDFKDNADLATEYLYDDNGNLVADANKKITSITYNYLNKPVQITVQDKGTINYYYDALGQRLRKIITPLTGTVDTFDYIGNFVYKNHVLQYLLNDQGRVRPVYREDVNAVDFVYDYHIKDHLGSVRTILSNDPAMSKTYLATHEPSLSTTEEQIFDNIPAVREDKPGSTGGTDAKAAKLNGNTSKVGTALMLRVMPGDKIKATVDAYYDGAYQQNNEAPTNTLVESLMGALLNGQNYSGIPAAELPAHVNNVLAATTNPAFAGMLDDLLNDDNNPAAPKAHLVYLVFNDKLELQPLYSKALQIEASANGSWSLLECTSCVGANQEMETIREAGYVMIYVDNASIGKEVWFDNLNVKHNSKGILEENFYYPFGLTVSNSAMGVTAQPLKYNGKEHETSFDLQTYEYGARQYNSQIGRWNGIDPLANKYNSISPFAYVANNPIKYIDPDGRQIVGVTKRDAESFKEDIYLVLADKKFDAIRPLISLDNTTFKSIDATVLAKALEGISLSADERAYVDMITNTINSKDVHKVEYLTGVNASVEGAEAFKQYMNGLQEGVGDKMVKNGVLNSALVTGLGGDGLNVPASNGSHSFISPDVKGKEKSITSGHEVFGHGIPSAQKDGEVNNNNNAIRTDNLIRRLLGLPQRDGKDHAGGAAGDIVEPQKLPRTK